MNPMTHSTTFTSHKKVNFFIPWWKSDGNLGLDAGEWNEKGGLGACNFHHFFFSEPVSARASLGLTLALAQTHTQVILDHKSRLTCNLEWKQGPLGSKGSAAYMLESCSQRTDIRAERTVGGREAGGFEHSKKSHFFPYFLPLFFPLFTIIRTLKLLTSLSLGFFSGGTFPYPALSPSLRLEGFSPQWLFIILRRTLQTASGASPCAFDLSSSSLYVRFLESLISFPLSIRFILVFSSKIPISCDLYM